MNGRAERIRPSDLSVIDRVTGRYTNISSFEGCAAAEILGISHSVRWVTVGYTSRADYFGHKLSTRKSRTVRPHLSKVLMGVRFLVGARGFEPPTSRSQTERTTRLCYAPKVEAFYESLADWSSDEDLVLRQDYRILRD